MHFQGSGERGLRFNNALMHFEGRGKREEGRVGCACFQV